MKTTFTSKEILSRRGCYEREKVEKLSFINQPEIKIQDILNSEIPLKDKRWFAFNSCDLTIEEKQQLALDLARVVLPIFEEKYPEDQRVRKCLEATEKFLKGEITKAELREFRRAYAATAAAAYATAYAAYAAAAYAEGIYPEKFVNAIIKFFDKHENS